MMNPVVARLVKIKPRRLAFLAVVHRLKTEPPESAEELLQIGPEIEAAMNEAGRVAGESRKVVEACLRLEPVPSEQPPQGF